MRLWAKQLIPFLPKLQLLSQWRECCCIAKNVAEKGTPNHVLVNRVLNYPLDNFVQYAELIIKEFRNRGYKINDKTLAKFRGYIEKAQNKFNNHRICDLYIDWHNDIYLRECLYNLEEKAICGAIPTDEWKIIYENYKEFIPLWAGEIEQ